MNNMLQILTDEEAKTLYQSIDDWFLNLEKGIKLPLYNFMKDIVDKMNCSHADSLWLNTSRGITSYASSQCSTADNVLNMDTNTLVEDIDTAKPLITKVSK